MIYKVNNYIKIIYIGLFYDKSDISLHYQLFRKDAI